MIRTAVVVVIPLGGLVIRHVVAVLRVISPGVIPAGLAITVFLILTLIQHHGDLFPGNTV